MKRSDVKERQGERRALALQLRKDGHTYQRIGEMLATQFGNQQNMATFSHTYARKLVHDAIKDIYKEDAIELVKMELQRLDDMQLEVLKVMRTEHYMVQQGGIVRVNVRDENGQYVIDQSTGLPASKPLLDDTPVLSSIDRLLKIQERRARLLGLDKPTKVAPTNPSGDKEAKGAVVMMSPTDAAL